MATDGQAVGPKQHAGPLVSCIMPTADRRRFVPEAIRLFLAQDYAARGLINLDDGADAVKDLIPDDPRIRYLRGTRRESVGAKRNRLCTEANGELTARWDDDDWHARSRLSRQAAEIVGGDADVCGLDRVLFFDPATQRAFEYVYPAGGSPWLYGATLCYRKSLWRRFPFPEISVGDDARFIAAVGGSPGAARIRTLAAPEMYVGLIHPGNTEPKRTNDPTWRSQPLHCVAEIARDWTQRPAGPAAANPLPAAVSAVGTASPPKVCIGIRVHSDPARLKETLTYLRANTAVATDVMLLGDGPTRRRGRRWRPSPATASHAPPPPVSIGYYAKAAGRCWFFSKTARWSGRDSLIPFWADLPRTRATGLPGRARTARGAYRVRCTTRRSPPPMSLTLRASPDRATARRFAASNRSIALPTFATSSGAPLLRQSAPPTRATGSAPAGRWTTPRERCDRASGQFGRRGLRVPP